KFESAKDSKFVSALIHNRQYGYQNFIGIIGRGQIGKSVMLLNLLIWYNQSTQFEKFLTYDLQVYLKWASEYQKTMIALEEAERGFRSHSSTDLQELSGIIIDFYETSPYRQNSLIISQPSLRLLKYLKTKMNFLINMVRRGVGVIYKETTSLTAEKIYFSRTKEVIHSYPLNVDLYKRYESYSYLKKSEFLSSDLTTISKYLKNQQNPYV
ncbi:MAG: hypothetical protein QXW39_09870, partial [Candidatus Bathyarchaeia archaeon]